MACPVSLPNLRASAGISPGPKATANTPAVATSSPRLIPNGIPRKRTLTLQEVGDFEPVGMVQVSRIQVGSTSDVTAAHRYLGKAHVFASRTAAVQDGFQRVHGSAR